MRFDIQAINSSNSLIREILEMILVRANTLVTGLQVATLETMHAMATMHVLMPIVSRLLVHDDVTPVAKYCPHDTLYRQFYFLSKRIRWQLVRNESIVLDYILFQRLQLTCVTIAMAKTHVINQQLCT